MFELKVLVSQDVASQSILSFENTKIMIDLGWDSALSSEVLDPIVEYLSSNQVDCILLSHPTIQHLGAYAYIHATVPKVREIKVYATLPVINLGRIATLEAYRSAGLTGRVKNEKVTLKEVEQAFDDVVPIKFAQEIELASSGLVVIPYGAGHSVGGTVWKIGEVVFGNAWNHSRDGVVNGAAFVDRIRERPGVFVCGGQVSLAREPLKKRKERLVSMVEDTIRKGGTVMMPSSVGGRIFEVLQTVGKARNVKLIYLGYLGTRLMGYAASMLEWMSQAVIEEWEVRNESPFDPSMMKMVDNVQEALTAEGPKVVLVTGEAIGSTGFSKELFAKLCVDKNNLVLLTERAQGGLSQTLYKEWEAFQLENQHTAHSNQPMPLSMKMMIDYKAEIPLQGDELSDYNLNSEYAKQQILSAINVRNEAILEQESSSDDDDDDDEMILSGQLDTAILIYGDGVYDYDVRTSTNNKPKMFPHHQKRRRIDDYGEYFALPATSTKALEHPTASTLAPALADGSNPDPRKPNDSDVVPADAIESLRLDSLSPTGPTPVKFKLVSESVRVQCMLAYVDLEGLTDLRSLKMIVPQLQPRHFVFLPPAPAPVQDLDSVKVGEWKRYPDVGRIGSSYQVTLELPLDWQSLGDGYSVSHVTGQISVIRGESKVFVEGSGGEGKSGEIEESNTEAIPVEEGMGDKEFALVPLDRTQIAPMQNPLMLGDIRLSELKRRLKKEHNIRSEFGAEGILVVGNDKAVAVKKLEGGEIVIEGIGFGDEFYKVKMLVRSMLAVI